MRIEIATPTREPRPIAHPDKKSVLVSPEREPQMATILCDYISSAVAFVWPLRSHHRCLSLLIWIFPIPFCVVLEITRVAITQASISGSGVLAGPDAVLSIQLSLVEGLTLKGQQVAG